MPPRPGAPGQDFHDTASFGDQDFPIIDPYIGDINLEDDSPVGSPTREGSAERGFMPRGHVERGPRHAPREGMQAFFGGRGGGGGGMMPPRAAGGRHAGHHGGDPRHGAQPQAGHSRTTPWHDLFESIVPELRCPWYENGHGPGSICESRNRSNLMEAAFQLGYRGPPDARIVALSLGPRRLELVAISIRRCFAENESEEYAGVW